MSSSKEEWWMPLFKFGVHLFVSTGIFILISIPAVALNLYVHCLETTSASRWIIYILIGLEGLIFMMDVVLFLRFLLLTFLNEFKNHD